MIERMMKLKEVAESSGVKLATIRKAIRDGKMDVIWKGNKQYVKESEVARWMECSDLKDGK